MATDEANYWRQRALQAEEALRKHGVLVSNGEPSTSMGSHSGVGGKRRTLEEDKPKGVSAAKQKFEDESLPDDDYYILQQRLVPPAAWVRSMLRRRQSLPQLRELRSRPPELRRRRLLGRPRRRRRLDRLSVQPASAPVLVRVLRHQPLERRRWRLQVRRRLQPPLWQLQLGKLHLRLFDLKQRLGAKP